MGCKQSIPVTSEKAPYPAFVHPSIGQLGGSKPLHRVLIIANPFGGGGKGRPNALLLEQRLKAKGVDVDLRFTQAAGHGMEIAASLMEQLDTYDAVCPVGGDGTAHEVLNGMIYSRILISQQQAAAGAATASAGAAAPAGAAPSAASLKPLPPVVLVPCGSGNTVAFNLGIKTVEDSLAILESGGQLFSMDIVQMTRPEDAMQDFPQLLPITEAPLSTAAAAATAAATTAAAEGAAAAPAGVTAAPALAAPAPEPAALQALKDRVRFSINMIGWGLSSSVLERVAAQRCMCGGAAYNCAAYSALLANENWVGELEFLHPSAGPQPLSKDAIKNGYSYLTARQPPTVTEAAAAPASSSSAPAATSSSTAEKDSGLASAAAATAAAGTESLLPPMPVPPTGMQLWQMLQVQCTAIMGDKMSFCPFARMDDGLMDICAVMPGSRMQLAAIMEEGKKNGSHCFAGQSPNQSGIAALAGETPRPLPGVRYCQAAELILRPATREQLLAWKESPTGQAAAAEGHTVCPVPLEGLNSVNIDGELSGFSPVRMKVLPRVIPIAVPGPRAAGAAAAAK